MNRTTCPSWVLSGATSMPQDSMAARNTPSLLSAASRVQSRRPKSSTMATMSMSSARRPAQSSAVMTDAR